MKYTTQKAALCAALLEGERVSIMDGFKKFGMTNLPREISRQVEQVFGVQIKRFKCKTKTKYGHACSYFEYQLKPRNPKEYFFYKPSQLKLQREGVRNMQKYVDEHSIPERIITPSKRGKLAYEKLPTKDDSHYVKTWPGFPADQVAAQYAREAEMRTIPRNKKTTAQIVNDALKRRNK